MAKYEFHITLTTKQCSFFLNLTSELSGGAVYLLGMALEHQVLLALIQSTFLQSPEMKDSVFPLEQLTEDTCTHRHSWISKMNTVQHI